ncbi:MAG TPA: AAA family ATPase, partial [Thermoanaerobaculia bacterium]|nr:AAA family ATPase [Thermoanaerobaculia bacterium]
AEAFRRAEASTPPFACVVGECSAATGESDAYLPFREVLKLLAGETEAPRKKSATLLAATGKVIVDIAPDLLGIFVPGSKLIASIGLKFAKEAGWMSTTPAKKVSAEIDQEKIFRQYTEVLQTIAQERPLVIALDDLQWADASSIALFFHLVRRIKEAKLLLIGTFRPNDIALGRGGERHPLEQVIFELKRYYGDIVIDLAESGDDERRAFVDDLIDSEPNALDAEFRAALLHHTEGHPLFTVELLRDLRERGSLAIEEGRWRVARDIDWHDLPPRIEGVIAERVERLEQELREILAVASVSAGAADFLAQIIVAIQNIDERRLLKLLSADLEKRHGLVLETGVRRRGRRILAHYRFTHALVQRYLYGSLGDAEKMLLHGDVAAILEEVYDGETEQIANDLAWHYLQAGDAENALRYLEIALDQCLRMSAYREALVHANRALELVAELPDSPERARREFKLILRWSVPTKALGGWTSPDLKPHYDRARELLPHVGDSPEATEFAFSVWTYYLVRCELAESREIAAQCLATAQRVGSPVGMLAAYTSLANTAFWSGDLDVCTENLQRAMEVYPTVDVQLHLLQYGMDTRVVVNEFDVWKACVEGRFEEARKTWLEFLPEAEALKHPFSFAIALNTGAWMYQMMGDVASTRVTADRLVRLATAQGFPSYAGLGTMLRGWAMTFGDSAAGIEELVAGFERWRTTAGPLITTYFALLHGDALRRANRPDEARAAVDGAIAFGESRGEKVFLPLLARLRAELG